MIVLILVHLIVVSVELVIREDELVGFGVVVVGRHIEDVLALHVGSRDRDVLTVVVLAARDRGHLAAAGALGRADAPAGPAAGAGRSLTAGPAACTGRGLAAGPA